jgi:agmatine deiminase
MTQYRMPAEWEPHRATWMAWPYLESDYPGKVDAVRWIYCEFIRHALQSETVEILCLNEQLAADLSERLTRQDIKGDIRVHIAPYNRAWLRDSGPIGVYDVQTKQPAWVSFLFTGWGARPEIELDQKVPSFIAKATNKNLLQSAAEKYGEASPTVLEGGMLDVSGDGLILVTEECLLSEQQQRNRGFSKKDYEAIFADKLGAPHTIWLPWGISGDDTHGHIDNVARFINRRTVVVASTDRTDTEQYAHLQENIEVLKSYRTPAGERLEVIELPMPEARYCDGDRLGQSYLNFYFLNDRLLVPTYNDIRDQQALGIISELVTDRKVIGLYCGDWILGGGTMHCSTQQEPA